jgi:hypothetical protein
MCWGDTDADSIGKENLESDTAPVSNRSATTSTSSKVIEPEHVPVLSRWTQSPVDRSITGYVRNSPDHGNGTEITILTFGKDVKRGSMVSTLSGKQY